MPVTINASTSSGLISSADTSGEISLQSNGTTVLGITSTGIAVTGTQSVSGNLLFNSGYGSSAVAYGCRAWVNFNGQGTVAIRASGGVTSITDNGTGAYTINFTTAMPDANYSVVSNGADITTSTLGSIGLRSASAATTTTVAVGSSAGDGSAYDQAYMNFAIFR